ncbi:unnamed protein product, partial [Polarella glacialis]
MQCGHLVCCSECRADVEGVQEVFANKPSGCKCSDLAASADAEQHQKQQQGNNTNNNNNNNNTNSNNNNNNKTNSASADAEGQLSVQRHRPLCKHFLRSGRCAYGEGCSFAHALPDHTEDLVNNSNNSKTNNNNKNKNNHSELQSVRSKACGERRKVVRKGSRVSVVRRFLIDSFGLELLRAGRGVLDVAGGGGDLAFELLNLNGIEATCIDPRPPGLAKSIKMWERGLYWRNPVWRKWNGESPQDGIPPPQSPQHAQLLFCDETTSWAREVANSGGKLSAKSLAWLSRTLEETKQLSWTAGAFHEDGERSGQSDNDGPDSVPHRPPSFYPTHLRNLPCLETAPFEGKSEATSPADDLCDQLDKLSCDTRVSTDSTQAAGIPDDVDAGIARTVADVFTGCSAVVGIHPDQAAGHIVEFAVATRKPFLVVPCCVYSSAFPKRMLPDGQLVKTWEQFIEYLMSLAPGSQRLVIVVVVVVV